MVTSEEDNDDDGPDDVAGGSYPGSPERTDATRRTSLRSDHVLLGGLSKLDSFQADGDVLSPITSPCQSPDVGDSNRSTPPPMPLARSRLMSLSTGMLDQLGRSQSNGVSVASSQQPSPGPTPTRSARSAAVPPGLEFSLRRIQHSASAENVAAPHVISVTSSPDVDTGAPARANLHPLAPIITSIEPATVNPAGGTLITIRGENFGTSIESLATLDLCGVDHLNTATWLSPTVLTVVARPHVFAHRRCTNAIATTEGGPGLVEASFIYFPLQVTLTPASTLPDAPEVNGLSPLCGPAGGGTPVRIRGQNLGLVGWRTKEN